jgi:hypothetical protein
VGVYYCGHIFMNDNKTIEDDLRMSSWDYEGGI